MRARAKGFVLITAIIFMIITTAFTAGLFTSVITAHRVAGEAGESGRIKGYYAAMAGVRYAMIMMNDPAILSALGAYPYYVQKSVKSDYSSLATDLGISNSTHDVTIKITNNGDSTYTVTSSYNL